MGRRPPRPYTPELALQLRARKLVFWYAGSMKTTFDLPDDLVRTIKVRAAQEDRRLKDLIEELLRKGLKAEEPRRGVRHRVKLPLIPGGHPARPEGEMTPERIAQLLLDDEVERVLGHDRAL